MMYSKLFIYQNVNINSNLSNLPIQQNFPDGETVVVFGLRTFQKSHVNVDHNPIKLQITPISLVYKIIEYVLLTLIQNNIC